jgi:hypothetical protein
MRRLAFVLLAGCAGAEAMALPASPAKVEPPTAIGLNPGESMAFEVKLAGVVAGEAQLAVGEIGTYEGHRALVVKSRAQTTGAVALIRKVIDEASTTIDLDTGRPLVFESLFAMNDKSTTAKATFVGNRAEITYQRNDETKTHTLRADYGKVTPYDAHSAMALLRGWKATPGTTRSVYVAGGRRLWRVDVKYAGATTIGSALGNRRAIRYDGASYRARANMTLESEKPARTFSVWLSDDADRVPLRVSAATELGDVVIELTEYTRP